MAASNPGGSTPYQNAMPFRPGDSPPLQPGRASIQSAAAQGDPTFSDREIAALIQDRKRYLSQGFVTAGFPLQTAFPGCPQGIIQEAQLAAGAPSVRSTETVGFTEYQTASGHAAAMAEAQLGDSYGQGCKIDHGATRYAQTINQRTGDVQYLKVKEDTGTDVNWISPDLAMECKFPFHDIPRGTGYLDFRGIQFVPKKMVRLPWIGKKDKSEHTDFYVAPDNSPIHLVVGNGFISSFGHAHEVFLDSKPAGRTAHIMVQERVTESELLDIQATRVEADRKAQALDRERRENNRRRSSATQSNVRRQVTGPILGTAGVKRDKAEE